MSEIKPGDHVAWTRSASPIPHPIAVIDVRGDNAIGWLVASGRPWLTSSLDEYYRVTLDADSMKWVRVNPHPIDDRLPDWLTPDVVAYLRRVYGSPAGEARVINVDRDGGADWAYSATADTDAYVTRIARIDPDGTVHVCNGKEVLS